jgi:peptide/nickel transport system permease protein
MTTRLGPLAAVGAGSVVVLVAVALLAPVLAPYEGQALVGYPLELPSRRHLLGTNGIGQDLLSQLIWGARASLTVAVAASALAMAVSLVVGVGGALVGGLVDTVAIRTVDVFLALPRLPLILIVAAVAGPSRLNVILVIGLLSWAPAARLLRSQVLSLRQRGFVNAARGFGGGALYVVRRHLVPAIGPVLVAVAVAVAGGAVMAEAGLAFLGLGDPLGVSWGQTLNSALAEPGLYYNPIWVWWVLPPGFAITLAVLGFTFLGVGLEPLMNPRATDRS